MPSRQVVRRLTLPPAMLRAMVRISGHLPANHPLRQRTEEAVADGQPVAPYPRGRVFVNGVEVGPPPRARSLTQVHVKDGRVGQETQCAVCLRDYEEDDVCSMLPCGHSFHSPCIHEWIKTRPNCPMCRQEL